MRVVNVILLILFFSLSNCTTKKSQLIGKYAAVNYTNTSDTIILLDGGFYNRKVYDKNKKLALQMKSSWSYEGSALVLNSFFLNLDRDINLYPELLSDTSMQMQSEIEYSLSNIQFCTGTLENKNCYKKIN